MTQQPAARFAALARDSRIEEIENEGMDEGRFFVHLKATYDWDTDHAENRRTESFGSIAEARRALKSVMTATPKKRNF